MADNQGKRPEMTFEKLMEFNTGNSDKITRRYLDQLLIEMRIIDSDLASTEAEIFGTKLATPIMLGAIAGYEFMGENAILREAEAAGELNTIMWLNEHMTDDEIKAVVGSGAKAAMVVKPYRDLNMFLDLAKKFTDLGCIAIASDIDHAYSRRDGGYDHSMQGVEFGPRSSDELRTIVSTLEVPFVAKGVLSVHDAVCCDNAGVKHIIVSHHHNIMDYSVPPLMILPDIKKAVSGDMTVIVDCGIDTGADAFKALALGADLVCTARAVMKTLRSDGKDGVVKLIRDNTAQLRNFLNRTGSPDISHIDPSVIHHLEF